MDRTATSQIIQCPGCGANNRVSPNEPGEKQAVCGRCKEPLPSASVKPLTITDANFSDIVEKSSLPVLVDLWAVWCPPCRMIAPSIDQLAAELAGKAVIGKLNVDENKMTAARFNVQSIPTLLILQNGQEVDRIVGAGSKEAIRRRLERFMTA